MWTIERYNTRTFGTTEQILEGGDLFHLVNSSVALNVVFYGAKRQVLGRANGITALKLNFFDGLLMKQSLDQKRAQGNNLPDLGMAFYKVGITAASSVIPDIIITSGGIDSESFAFAGNVSILPASSILGRAAISMADTDTETIAANSARKGGFVKNAAASGSGALWVTDTAALSDGVPLFPGDSMPLACTGAVQVYSEGANILSVVEFL